MKRSLAFGFLMVLFSLSLHAAQNSQKVFLTAPTRVGAATLPAGECKLTWAGSGADVQLTFAVKGQNPVTVPAEVVEKKSGVHAMETSTVNGVDVLHAVILDKVTFVLRSSSVSGN